MYARIGALKRHGGSACMKHICCYHHVNQWYVSWKGYLQVLKKTIAHLWKRLFTGWKRPFMVWKDNLRVEKTMYGLKKTMYGFDLVSFRIVQVYPLITCMHEYTNQWIWIYESSVRYSILYCSQIYHSGKYKTAKHFSKAPHLILVDSFRRVCT